MSRVRDGGDAMVRWRWRQGGSSGGTETVDGKGAKPAGHEIGAESIDDVGKMRPA
jgi:hypothetical protein